MKEEAIKAILKLLNSALSVKSIISIIVAIVFYKLSISGALDPSDVKGIILMVFTFFFGYQAGKDVKKTSE